MSFKNKGLSKLQGTPWHIEYLRKPESERQIKPSREDKLYAALEQIEHAYPEKSALYQCAKDFCDAIRRFDLCVSDKSLTHDEYKLLQAQCRKTLLILNERIEESFFESMLTLPDPVVRFASFGTIKQIAIHYKNNESPVISEKRISPSFSQFMAYSQAKGICLARQEDWKEKFRDAYSVGAITKAYSLTKKEDVSLSVVNASAFVQKSVRESLKNNGVISDKTIERLLQRAIDSIVFSSSDRDHLTNRYKAENMDCKRLRFYPDLKVYSPKDSTIIDICFSIIADIIVRKEKE